MRLVQDRLVIKELFDYIKIPLMYKKIKKYILCQKI